jgi:hypothetical protein
MDVVSDVVRCSLTVEDYSSLNFSVFAMTIFGVFTRYAG